MNSSEILEEILHEAYTIGIADDVFREAQKYLNMGLSQCESYEKAFYEVLEIISSNC